jgi:lipopolysaccharide biosynthesis protein
VHFQEHEELDMEIMKTRCRIVAYYLPQFHPIPENDEWWGKGFTEWSNVAKAKPLFPGHYQPHVPADLGFYDLRVPETRAAQAEMAKQYGIEGFCYYHYWFGNGKRLLERPFNDVLRTGEPDYPFCLCWANETWTGRWHGSPNRILIEQTYPPGDDEKHFYHLIEAFNDKRYIRIDEKPVFLVYRPGHLPAPKRTTDCWRELANKNGLNGLYLVGVADKEWVPSKYGFDASTLTIDWHPAALGQMKGTRKIRNYLRRMLGFPGHVYLYGKASQHFIARAASQTFVHPCVVPNWDNSPRCGKNGVILHKSTPELFRKHLKQALDQVMQKPYETRFVFLKSWNEWAEGNHLEPDLRYGRSYLQVLKEENTPD